VPEDSKVKSAKETESSTSSWWQTLPGALTAIAATITAITGLVVALHQANIFPTSKTSPTPSKTTVQSPSTSTNPQTPTPTVSVSPDGAAPSPTINEEILMLPAGMEARLPVGAGGTVVYKILSAQLEPFNAENRSLKLTIRCTANHQYAVSFGSHSFRLLVDQVPRSPTNLLNEVVEPQSAKEGEIIFTVPNSTSKATLKIGDPGKETTQIPFDFSTTKPSQPR
jgi:hypothetical protein